VTALPCDRCGEWRLLDADGVCHLCAGGAEDAALADLTQDEHRKSQTVLEAWLGIQFLPVGGR
jgi:molybdenum cofactor biosynthesis enzyme MoaA